LDRPTAETPLVRLEKTGDATAVGSGKGSPQSGWAHLCEFSRRCFCLPSHQSRTSFKIAGTTGIATAANIIQSVFVMEPISGE